MTDSYFGVSTIEADVDFSLTSASLDASQQARLSAIQNPQRRQQFLSARHLALQLLQSAQVDSMLSQSAEGRPVASAWPFSQGLSWSHGRQFCAAALGQGRVGIDIESIRPRQQCMAIAQQYFDPRETAWLASLPSDLQTKAFFTLWVAKEALLKALGTGIVGGLARFVLLKTASGWRCEHPDAAEWHLRVWEVSPDVLLALASDVEQQWISHTEPHGWQLILQV